VIENYADAMVLLKYREEDMKKTYTRSILGKPALRTEVTVQYKQEFDKIFEDYLFQYPPLEAGKIYREEFHHDMGFLLERVNKINELENEEWASLVNSNNMPSEDLAIERLLRAYGKRYEILRDILRSYAYLLKRDSNDDVDLNSTRRVINYLDTKGYSFIQNVIIPEFRNGISHESMQMEDGTLEIYEDRIRAEEPERKLSTQEVAENLNKFFELFFGVIYSYSIKEEEFLFNVFSSDEFKYYIGENYV
jgi:plasmid maintenance system antidote protein VapI